MASKFPKLGPKEGFFSEFDIKYEGPATKNPLAFKYYNKDEVVLGKPMKEWLRFAVCYWHTWRGNGADIFGLGGSIKRPWDGDDMEAALTRVDVHFAKVGGGVDFNQLIGRKAHIDFLETDEYVRFLIWKLRRAFL